MLSLISDHLSYKSRKFSSLFSSFNSHQSQIFAIKTFNALICLQRKICFIKVWHTSLLSLIVLLIKVYRYKVDIEQFIFLLCNNNNNIGQIFPVNTKVLCKVYKVQVQLLPKSVHSRKFTLSKHYTILRWQIFNLHPMLFASYVTKEYEFLCVFINSFKIQLWQNSFFAIA